MSPLQHFRTVATQATATLNHSFNAPDLVPYGQELLKLIDANPEHRNAFAREFIQSINRPEAIDLWLVQFCVQALRWPEL